jgi:hypothetical protein
MSRMNYKSMSDGVLDAAFKKLKLKPPTQKTVPAKAAVLKEYFEKNTKREDISKCTTCGGLSDANYDVCPYCGDGDVIDPSVAAAATAITTTGTEVEVATKEGGYVKINPEDLDNSLAKIRELKRNVERSIWELGIEIKHVHDEELWKARLIDGQPEFKTWKAFCAGVLQMSHTHAYGLIEVASTFTREQVEMIGTAKLKLIVGLPEDKRAAALAAAEQGASTKEVGALAGKGPKDTNKDTGDVVTFLARANKKTTLVLLAASGEKGKPAQQIADEPWVEEEHENGVVSRYVVKLNKKTGNLELVITRRR